MAMLELYLKDEEYPFTGVTHVRKVARGIVLDENNNVAIHQIYRDDRFCKQWYYETPGGGVDEGETFEEAFIRECGEEIGCDVEILAILGDVHDFYNLIGRENHNRFFLARILRRHEKHFASQGDLFIQKTLFVPIDEAIDLYQKQDDRLVAGLVKRRELPILLEAKTRIKQ